MATDLETGETGNPFELLAKSLERRQQRWNDHIRDGLLRVQLWKREHPNRKVRPTRFYKLLHG